MTTPNRLALALRRLAPLSRGVAVCVLFVTALAACEEDDPPIGAALVTVRPDAPSQPTAENLATRRSTYLKAERAARGEAFGTAVSMSADGTRLAIGVMRDASSAHGVNGTSDDRTAYGSGAVYVFARSGEEWKQEAYVKGSNSRAGDHFGSSVALSANGRTLAVGAPEEGARGRGINADQTPGGPERAGAAYIFTRAGTTWTQEAFIKASNSDEDDCFAAKLALSADGDHLAIGAMSESSSATGVGGDPTNNDASGAGAVYVFARADSRWTEEAYLKASNAASGSGFGVALSISGDGTRLAVGATGEDSSATGVGGDQANRSAMMSGAAYTFTRRGSSWAQDAYIKASDTAQGAFFGGAVALSAEGTRLAVGSMTAASRATGLAIADGLAAPTAPTASGAVYVFAQAGATWQQEFKASTGQQNGFFGSCVSLSADGGQLAVGASGESSNRSGVSEGILSTSRYSGAAHVFSRTGTGWVRVAHLKASNTGPDDSFGRVLAISGDGTRLAVGAPFEDSAASGINGNEDDDRAADSGAVYVY